MTVVILDDHPLLSRGLAEALRHLGVRASALELTAGEDHVAQVLGLSGDTRLIVSDMVMPAVPNPSALISKLSAICPVIVLSGSEDDFLLGQCLEAGAVGVLSKNEPIDAILSDLIGFLESGKLRPAARVARLQVYETRCRVENARKAHFEHLTTAEGEVLGLLCDGYSAARIAQCRFVSVATVRTQIKAVLTKLDASSQLAAVAMANRFGFESSSIEKVSQ